MSITLNLKPEVEASLLARTRANGVSVEEYLLSVVESTTLPSGRMIDPTKQPAREVAVRCMVEFGGKYHLNLGEPITRKLLHEGHRF